ncbi:hypothetical protein [Clostridium tertium]|jgi:hypothetical protein|nr:hypothetical protein [Clostridium sp.]
MNNNLVGRDVKAFRCLTKNKEEFIKKLNKYRKIVVLCKFGDYGI